MISIISSNELLKTYQLNFCEKYYENYCIYNIILNILLIIQVKVTNILLHKTKTNACALSKLMFPSANKTFLISRRKKNYVYILCFFKTVQTLSLLSRLL